MAQVLLLPDKRVRKVTTVRHGDALGLSAMNDTQERYNRTDREILAQIQVSPAARLGYYGMSDELVSFVDLRSSPESLKALHRLLRGAFWRASNSYRVDCSRQRLGGASIR